ncbi:MAG: antibiotic biosynthesis monooxygenase [Actinomycetota bacterium]|nr:antibiotic biosynthesis monooxygenase [Actinomycetota bacterium]
MTVYTLGIWTIQEGREAEFVGAWENMARMTKQHFPAAAGTLLRDQERATRFISFGPWESLEQVEEWRESAAFRNGVARIREVLDGFEPSTLDLVARVE